MFLNPVYQPMLDAVHLSMLYLVDNYSVLSGFYLFGHLLSVLLPCLVPIGVKSVVTCATVRRLHNPSKGGSGFPHQHYTRAYGVGYKGVPASVEGGGQKGYNVICG